MTFYVGKTHKDTIPPLDGNIEKIAADEVLKTLDVEKHKVILTPPVDKCPLCKDAILYSKSKVIMDAYP